MLTVRADGGAVGSGVGMDPGLERLFLLAAGNKQAANQR
jgi:hypothetical protein